MCRSWFINIDVVQRTMKRKLFVLMGDVISSRRIGDRDKFQKELEETCKEINSIYREDIYANFNILKGIDEISGVLSTISNCYRIITTFQEQLYPNSMRFGLVLDYVDTGLESKDAARMDGPAFHKVSHIMDKLKESRLVFGISAGDEMIDTAIANQVNLVLLLRKNWSPRQRQMIKEYERVMNQYELAKDLGTTQQNISAIINRSMWREIKSVEEDINYIFHEYSKRLQQGCDTG